MNREAIQPHIQLAIMSREYVISRSIQAIAHLGIADHMTDQPVSVEELARLTSTVPELLERMLNFLSVYGLFLKNGDAYALTPLSAPLKSDHPHSIKDVLSMVDESWWQAFAHLETTLKTGTPSFKIQQGTDFFSYLSTHPEKKIRFQKGISKLAASDNRAITQAYNFGHFKKIIDIGAGQDELAKAIKTSFASVSVAQFNLMEQMTKHPAKDYFSSLANADAYILKGILHDFEDEKIKKILNTLHQHIPSQSTLIIAEQVIPEHDLPHTNKTMDIIMMVLVGGRQRNSSGWRELIESTGFKLKKLYQTESVYTIMEFLT